MNRTLPCGCRWIAGRIYACSQADALQRGIETTEAVGNVHLLQLAEHALIAHWRDQGLTRREFDVLMQRAGAHRT